MMQMNLFTLKISSLNLRQHSYLPTYNGMRMWGWDQLLFFLFIVHLVLIKYSFECWKFLWKPFIFINSVIREVGKNCLSQTMKHDIIFCRISCSTRLFFSNPLSVTITNFSTKTDFHLEYINRKFPKEY